MIGYRMIPKNDYEKIVKFGKEDRIACYSKKQMKKRYPEKQFSLAGETKKKNQKKKIATLEAANRSLIVSEAGANGKLLNKTVGYICVGEDLYVAMLQSRAAFLLALLCLLLGLLTTILIMMHLLKEPSDLVLNPYNPLPETDPYAEAIADDSSDKISNDNGGGAVSMSYSLDVTFRLATGEADIYFQNPNASNHDVALELYIVSEGQEVLLASSGLVEPGNGLYKLYMTEDHVILQEGLYEGKYKLIFYNPDTGERALVESEITDLTVTVTQ